jgi:hypothetical protein
VPSVGQIQEAEGANIMTDEQLTKLEELCEKATPGPWRISRDARLFPLNLKADGRFIAAARTALPELIAEVRRLRTELEISRKVLEETCTWFGSLSSGQFCLLCHRRIGEDDAMHLYGCPYPSLVAWDRYQAEQLRIKEEEQ